MWSPSCGLDNTCLAEETGKTVLKVLEMATLVWQEKCYVLRSDRLAGELFGRMDSVRLKSEIARASSRHHWWF